MSGEIAWPHCTRCVLCHVAHVALFSFAFQAWLVLNLLVSQVCQVRRGTQLSPGRALLWGSDGRLSPPTPCLQT